MIGIIGTGSAAKRIYHILKKINNNLGINFYSNTRNYFFINKKKYFTKELKFKKIKLYEKIFFIANNSSEHFKYLQYLIKKQRNIYVEKPICTNSSEAKKIFILYKKFKGNLTVGYQFRENDSLKFLLNKIKKNINKIVSVSAYSGEDVKKYHKNEDYKKSYTVSKEKGGGVLLTQIHQIDYLSFLFGEIIKIKAMQNKKNKYLNTNVETNVSYLLKTKNNILINCNLNYYSKKLNLINIYLTDGIIIWNNEKNSVIIHKKKKLNFLFNQTRQQMFYNRISNFLKNLNKKRKINNFKKDLDPIFVVDRIKKDIS
jgi:predicted dehydrogenase